MWDFSFGLDPLPNEPLGVTWVTAFAGVGPTIDFALYILNDPPIHAFLLTVTIGR
jgi:hypothetical protein